MILWNEKRILQTVTDRATISQKKNIAKIGKLIFHSFQNIVQHFGPSQKSTLFEGAGVGLHIIIKENANIVLLKRYSIIMELYHICVKISYT